MNWIRKHARHRTQAKEAKLRSEAIDEVLKQDASVYRRQVRMMVIGPTADTQTLIQRFVSSTATVSRPVERSSQIVHTLSNTSNNFNQIGKETCGWRRAISETAREIGSQLALERITDVDLISSSYFLRASIDQAELANPSHPPAIETHLLPASHSTDLYNRISICYAFTGLGLLDLSHARVVGFFEGQQPLFVVNLKTTSTQEPRSSTKLIHTMLELYRSLCNSRMALRMEMVFFVFTHVDDIRQELETTTTAAEMLIRIFDDFNPDLESEYASGPGTLPYLDVIKYIIRRFNEITPELCQLIPIMMQTAPDRNRDRFCFQAMHEAILQNALRVCCCFGSSVS